MFTCSEYMIESLEFVLWCCDSVLVRPSIMPSIPIQSCFGGRKVTGVILNYTLHITFCFPTSALVLSFCMQSSFDSIPRMKSKHNLVLRISLMELMRTHLTTLSYIPIFRKTVIEFRHYHYGLCIARLVSCKSLMLSKTREILPKKLACFCQHSNETWNTVHLVLLEESS